jgi:NADH-quinone oxidoreductase subunit A
LYALLFVAFDVEIVFIYIWALNFKVLLFDGLISMAIFIGVLLVGLAYAWRKGVLAWR